MELSDFARSLRRRWVSALLTALVFFAACVGVAYAVPPRYAATAQVFFATTGGTAADSVQSTQFAQEQVGSYATVATSPLVLDRVIATLRLDETNEELARRVSATAAPGTVVLRITATDPDPARAAAVANAVGDQVAAAVQTLTPAQPRGALNLQTSFLGRAPVPQDPTTSLVTQVLAIGLGLAVLLGIVVALVREAREKRVRDARDLEELSALPVVGSVPFARGSQPVAVRADPTGAAAEAVRRLRTQLYLSQPAGSLRALVVSSVDDRDAATRITLNLAVAAADAGSRVLVVDTDVRHPGVAAGLGLGEGAGLADVLAGTASPADAIQKAPQWGLDVLPAGLVAHLPGGAAEVLTSRALAGLVRELSGSYDLVLLAAPPMVPEADAAALSRVADGLLVVVAAGRTRRSQLAQALTAIRVVEDKTLGFVVAGGPKRDAELTPTVRPLAPSVVGATSSPGPVAAGSTAAGPATNGLAGLSPR